MIPKLASDLGITTAQLALAWCLTNPQVSTVLLGATSPDQLAENLRAADAKHLLTQDVLERIEAIMNNRPKAPHY